MQVTFIFKWKVFQQALFEKLGNNLNWVGVISFGHLRLLQKYNIYEKDMYK